MKDLLQSNLTISTRYSYSEIYNWHLPSSIVRVYYYQHIWVYI